MKEDLRIYKVLMGILKNFREAISSKDHPDLKIRKATYITYLFRKIILHVSQKYSI